MPLNSIFLDYYLRGIYYAKCYSSGGKGRPLGKKDKIKGEKRKKGRRLHKIGLKGLKLHLFELYTLKNFADPYSILVKTVDPDPVFVVWIR